MTFIQKSARLFEHLSADRRKAASRRGKTGLPTAQDGLSEKEKQRVYNEQAVAVVDKIKADNRLAAQKLLEDTQVKAANDVVPTLAAKLKLSETDLNRKIDNTAKKYGMTREQVLQQLSKGI